MKKSLNGLSVGALLLVFFASVETFARQPGSLKWYSQATLDQRYKRTAETVYGDAIVFPGTSSIADALIVELWTIFSLDTNLLTDPDTYQGYAMTIGDVPLQFFHSIDVLIHNQRTWERMTLEDYVPSNVGVAPPIAVKFKTSCDNAHLSPIDTWYLDDASGAWFKHDSQATFIAANRLGQCFFKYDVTHF